MVAPDLYGFKNETHVIVLLAQCWGFLAFLPLIPIIIFRVQTRQVSNVFHF